MKKRLFKQTQFITNGLVLLMVLLVSCTQENKTDQGVKSSSTSKVELDNALFEKQRKNISPYTLNQIEAHLREIYQGNIETKKGLQRWEVPILRYDIGSFKKALSEQEKSILINKLEQYSEITGIPTKRSPNTQREILILFTGNFLESIQDQFIRRILFQSPSDKSFEKIYNQFKNSTQRSYGVRYAIKSNKINRAYLLTEINQFDRKHLDLRADFIIYDVLVPRAGELSGLSNVIKPSILNELASRPEHYRHLEKENIEYLQPIDRYLLEVLYSDKVYYGMPIEEAIEVMSREIYQKLRG